MTNLLPQVRPFLDQLARNQPEQLPPATKLLIAVSGGPDSLALLHLLTTIYPPESLVAAHVNHQLRPSAHDEAKFVSDTAVSWRIPCHIKEVDVAAWAAAHKQSLEEAGRMVRYQYFAELAEKVDAQTIVTAHHADDQAETVLMHLLRGSGLAGLRGIAAISPLQAADRSSSLLLIRPFLHITRAQIEAYCQQHQLQPIMDESNADMSFLRNRLRHELLPLLETYNPQIKRRLNHLATVVGADYALLDEMLQTAWTAVCHTQRPDVVQLKRTDWLKLPLSLRRSTLRHAVQQLRPFLRDISFASIEQARCLIEKGHSGAQASLPGDLVLVVGYEHLTITADPQHIPTDLPQLLRNSAPLPLPVPGQVQLANNWTVTASLAQSVELATIQTNTDPWIAYVAVAEAAPLMVRARKPGERLRPLGMEGHSTKLKELMIDRKIPAHLRANWPLIVQQKQLLWVVGIHQDERVRVTPEARHVIKLQCYRQ